MFITFEGIEGAGKSTQLNHWATYLRNKGHTVVTTREPGGTPVGQKIRHLLLTTPTIDPHATLCLFFADRFEHIRQVIKPALDAGSIVLCDRFVDSTVAYQHDNAVNKLRHLLIDQLDQLDHLGTQPDCTFLYDLPVSVAFERVSQRGSLDAIESKSSQFHHRVRQRYLQCASQAPHRIAVIDATYDSQTVFQNTLRCGKIKL